MFIKGALFYVMAFVVVQGSSHGDQSIGNYEKNVVGIWESIKEIIENIKNALGNLGENISEIIKKLEEKIKEILRGMNLNEVIENIISKIKEVVGGFGGVVVGCIEEQRPAIDKLAEESHAASMVCVQEAQAKINDIKSRVVALSEKANELTVDSINRGLKCMKDNIMHPAAIIPCFNSQVEIITQKMTELNDEAVALVQMAAEIASEAASSLGICMSKVAVTTNSKQNDIINAIQACISAH